MIHVNRSAFGAVRLLLRSAVSLLCLLFLAVLAAAGLAGLTAARASTQSYSITDLGTLSGGFETDAYGLNGTGQAAGQAVVKVTTGSGYNYLWHAFLYSSGTLTDLGTLGGDSSEARGSTSTETWPAAPTCATGATPTTRSFITTGA